MSARIVNLLAAAVCLLILIVIPSCHGAPLHA